MAKIGLAVKCQSYKRPKTEKFNFLKIKNNFFEKMLLLFFLIKLCVSYNIFQEKYSFGRFPKLISFKKNYQIYYFLLNNARIYNTILFF